MILSPMCFYSSTLPSSASISLALGDAESSKPRKVGRPKKKKEVEIAFVEINDPILPEGDGMSANDTTFESVANVTNNGLQEDNYSFDDQGSNVDESAEEFFEDGSYDDSEDGPGDSSLSSNQMLVTLSYSLLSQLKQMARMEGVSPDDIILELIAEGVTKRAFQDFSRPKPSHLMTRTGYVPPEANGNSMAQPQLSHHMQQNSQSNGNNNRGGNGNRRFGNNGGGAQSQNPNNPFFQNRGTPNGRFGNNGNAMQGQNRGNSLQGNGPQGNGNNSNKNMQRNKKNFNPNFQRNGNGPASGPRPQAGGFNPNANGNGSFNSDKDSDE